jgi:hypothetical protein
MRKTMALLVLTSSLGLIALPVRSGTAQPPSSPAPSQIKTCANVIDQTTTEVKARLAHIVSARAIAVGEPLVYLSAATATKSQTIGVVDDSGTALALTVTCTSTCPTGFSPVGCDPVTTPNPNPNLPPTTSCTALTCKAQGLQDRDGTCAKSVSM